MREYAFELALCAHREPQVDGLLARQLGASCHGTRVLDVVELAPGPRFDDRVSLCPGTIPAPVLESDVGPGTARDPREALDAHPDRLDDVVEAAVTAGYLERERRDGRPVVRATARYPDDWVGSLTAIENKPDLGTPGDLAAQLRYDAALGLFDEAILATASYVTRAHLNRIPDPVGVWRFDPETGEREVVREPSPLDPDAPGVEIREERSLRTDVSLVGPESLARKRRRIAERAYGKGWRPAPPGCAHATGTADGRPYCERFDRVVDPGRDCGAGCDAYDPADPPAVDRDRLRDERTAWAVEPGGDGPRRQSGLSRFL